MSYVVDGRSLVGTIPYEYRGAVLRQLHLWVLYLLVPSCSSAGTNQWQRLGTDVAT